MKEQYYYKAFGFTISSQFYFPELTQGNSNQKDIDIEVKQYNLTDVWDSVEGAQRYFHIEKDYIMFHVPKIAIFLIKNGKEILVSPFVDSEEDQIRLYILGTCMGAILLQRKILPLHGSAVVIDNKAYAIVGHSGAGKSTLATAFLNRGYQLLSDDVIPVSLNEDGIPFVTPAYPQQKLWIESLHQFRMDSEDLRPIIDRETKFAIPVSAQFAREPMPLAGVIELTRSEDDELELIAIENLERLRMLFTHTYRSFFIAPSGLLEWHFNTTAKIVNRLEMYQIKRPENRFTANELRELILSTIIKEEKVV